MKPSSLSRIDSTSLRDQISPRHPSCQTELDMSSLNFCRTRDGPRTRPARHNENVTLPWDFRPIHGERVTLDLLRPDDFEAMYAMQSDADVCRYLLYEPRSREQVAEALKRDAAATRLEEPGDFLQPAIRRSVFAVWIHCVSCESNFGTSAATMLF